MCGRRRQMKTPNADRQQKPGKQAKIINDTSRTRTCAGNPKRCPESIQVFRLNHSAIVPITQVAASCLLLSKILNVTCSNPIQWQQPYSLLLSTPTKKQFNPFPPIHTLLALQQNTEMAYFHVNEGHLTQIQEMGFARDQAEKALSVCHITSLTILQRPSCN